MLTVQQAIDRLQKLPRDAHLVLDSEGSAFYEPLTGICEKKASVVNDINEVALFDEVSGKVYALCGGD